MATLSISGSRSGSAAEFARKARQHTVFGRIGNALSVAGAWIERSRQRRALMSLSDHSLKDLGLSRADVDGELRKPFWRD